MRRLRTINYLQTQQTPKPKAQSPFDVPPLRHYYMLYVKRVRVMMKAEEIRMGY